MEGRRPGETSERARSVDLRTVIELAQHEWGLSWRRIEATWTDELLYMMLRAYGEREARAREWDLDKLRFLARVWGVEVPGFKHRTSPEDKYALLRQMGGKVTEVH